MRPLLLHQTRYDLLGVLRNRRARIFTLIMPVALLAIFCAAWGDQLVGSGADRARLSTYYVPGLTALGIIGASFGGVAIAVAYQRETGILKRRRATPVPAWVLVLGRALASIAVSLALTALMVAIGRIAFDVKIESAGLVGLILTAAVGSVAFCCLGFAVSTALSSPDSAAPIVNLALVPLFLISGVYYPNVDFPSWLQDLARVFPVEPLVNGLRQAFVPGATGVGIGWADVGVLVAWGLVGLGLAAWRFTWLPKAAAA
jgi:ABC-2 type transport system permease protein